MKKRVWTQNFLGVGCAVSSPTLIGSSPPNKERTKDLRLKNLRKQDTGNWTELRLLPGIPVLREEGTQVFYLLYSDKVHCNKEYNLVFGDLALDWHSTSTGHNLWLDHLSSDIHQARYWCSVETLGSLDPVNLPSLYFGYRRPLVWWECNRHTQFHEVQYVCHFFILKSQSLILFSMSLLSSFIEKGPTSLWLDIEIEWHSNWNGLCNSKLSLPDHLMSCQWVTRKTPYSSLPSEQI